MNADDTNRAGDPWATPSAPGFAIVNGELVIEPIETAQRRFDLGRAAWPHMALEFDRFERYFARHVTPEGVPGETYAPDMYLACACAHGIDQALAVFERTLAGDVARAVASIHSAGTFVEETMQVTREKLFVQKSADLGKIAEYGGRASLRSWLCAVAVRSAISRRRRKGEQHHRPFVEGDDRRLASGGPEFEYLRARYKNAFEDAIRNAIARLPAKDRMLLRLNLVDGMSVDKLGTAYRVGRSTAARWLASARRALLNQARRELRATLLLTSTELDGLAVDIQSHLEVSVLRLLAR